MPEYTIHDLLSIMKRLRKDCPWDAKQTHDSLKPYLLEEAYEVLETIDSQNWDELARELGDLLLQVVFHSELASEAGHFNFDDVADRIAKKLVQRHPHVFNKSEAISAEDVQANWEHSKLKSEKRDSLLQGIPKSMPALLSAQRLQEKAATVGFEWKTIQPVFDKVHEEWAEFNDVYQSGNQDEMRKEFGDVLFALVNLGRFLNINAEDALRQTNNKFIRRFKHIEKNFNHDHARMNKASLEELDAFWEEAKQAERP